MNIIEKELWAEKYRPKTIEDVILPVKYKIMFKNMIANNDIPNMLLVGSPGTGKTTVARAICNELNADMIFINASDDRGIDNLRNKVKVFASTMSASIGVKKIIVLDEADNLSTPAIMALRGFIEQCASNARFIFTANYLQKFPDAIRSRLQTVEFQYTKEEKQQCMRQFAQRIGVILKEEGISVTDNGKKALVEFIKKMYPDMRKILVELNGFAKIDKEINEGLLLYIDSGRIELLYDYLKTKRFVKVREWVKENQLSNESIYNQIYTDIERIFVNDSIPVIILLLNKYIYEAGFCMIPEINLISCCIEIMNTGVFK